MSVIQIFFAAPMVIFLVTAALMWIVACVFLVVGFLTGDFEGHFFSARAAAISTFLSAIFSIPCYFLGMFQ